MSILIALFLIAYLILAIIRLEWAVLLILAALPSYMVRFGILGVPFTLLEAMILIAFAVWVVRNFKQIVENIRLSFKNGILPPQMRGQNDNRVRYPFDIEISLLLIISFVAAGIAGFNDSALGIWKAYFFEPALLFILILNLAREKKFMRRMIWTLTVSAFFVSLAAIYQFLTGDLLPAEWAEQIPRRATSIFSYPNAVGLYLAPLILIFEGWLVVLIKNSTPNTEKIQLLKLIYFNIIIVLSVLAVILARSEGALLGIIAGLIIFGLLFDKKVRIATLIVIVFVAVGITVYSPARNYAINKIALRDLSGEIRKQQWRETWKMQTSSPIKFIFGTGLANYRNAIAPYHQDGIFFNKDKDPEFHRHVVWNDEYKKSHWQPVEIYLYPHNILLNFWTELGLAGLLLFAWIIGKYFILGIRNYEVGIMNKKDNYFILGLIGAMVAIVIHGIVDVPYFKNDLAILFWVLIAMVGLIKIKNENIKN